MFYILASRSLYTHKKNRGEGGVPAASASAILKSHKRRRDQPFLGTGAKVGVPWLPNAARPRCPSLDRSSMETEYEEVALRQSFVLLLWCVCSLLSSSSWWWWWLFFI